MDQNQETITIAIKFEGKIATVSMPKQDITGETSFIFYWKRGKLLKAVYQKRGEIDLST